MNVCPKCKRQLSSPHYFCHKCGVQYSEETLAKPSSPREERFFSFTIILGLVLFGWPFIVGVISELLGIISSCNSAAGVGGYSNCKILFWDNTDFINTIQTSMYFAFFTMPIGIIIFLRCLFRGLFGSKDKTNHTIKRTDDTGDFKIEQVDE